MAAPAAAGASLDEFVSLWPAVLDALRTYSKVGWMTFSGSKPVSLSDGVLAVAVEDSGKANNVRASGHDERLRQAILDVLKVDVRIDVVLAPDAPPRSPAAAGKRPGTAPAAPAAPAPEASAPDDPSVYDPTADDGVGVDLAMRALGATQIGEIEH